MMKAMIPAHLVDKKEERIQGMFAAIAPTYDFLNHLLTGGMDRYWRWQLTRKVPVKHGGPLLDLCTGTGDVAFAYERATRYKIPIIASDFCVEMLQLAQAKARKQEAKAGRQEAKAGKQEAKAGKQEAKAGKQEAKAGKQEAKAGKQEAKAGKQEATDRNEEQGSEATTTSERPHSMIRFVQADAQELPFAENTFEVTTISFGLRNVTKLEKGIAEMIRVTKPGGQIAILECSRPRYRLIAAIYFWYFRRLVPRIGHWFSKSPDNAYTYLPESVMVFPSGQELADRLLAQGLVDVKFFPMTFGAVTLYVGTKRSS